MPNCTRLANTELQIPFCKFIAKHSLQSPCKAGALYVTGCFCHRPHKILFVNVTFAARKGTFANFFQNLSFCVTETTCFLRLHLWKKNCCKPWERQTTNPFHFGAILVRFQNHIRNARLKSLTLSSFNHTAGRRFLPFGITAISKWFGDYLSLTT